MIDGTRYYGTDGRTAVRLANHPGADAWPAIEAELAQGMTMPTLLKYTDTSPHLSHCPAVSLLTCAMVNEPQGRTHKLGRGGLRGLSQLTCAMVNVPMDPMDPAVGGALGPLKSRLA